MPNINDLLKLDLSNFLKPYSSMVSVSDNTKVRQPVYREKPKRLTVPREVYDMNAYAKKNYIRQDNSKVEATQKKLADDIMIGNNSKDYRYVYPLVGPTVGTYFTAGGFPIFNLMVPQISLGAVGVYNLASPEGISKTYNHFKDSQYGKGILSGIGDALNATLVGLGINGVYRAGNTLYKTGQPYYNSLRDYNKARLFTKQLNTDIKQADLSTRPIPINVNNRTKIGDVEIDDPNLYYRQGSKEMADDFIESGVVLTDGDFYNPMFAKGKLWYGIPSKEEIIEALPLKNNSKFDFDFTRKNEAAPKTHLLIANSSTPMSPANKNSGKLKSISTKLRNISIFPGEQEDMYIKEAGPEFVKQWNKHYYDDELNNVPVIHAVDAIRLVPSKEGAANIYNTNLFLFEPNYGYRRINFLNSSKPDFSDFLSIFKSLKK